MFLWCILACAAYSGYSEPHKCTKTCLVASVNVVCVCLQEQIYGSSDIGLLLREVQKAQRIINKIIGMRQGLLGTALVSVTNEVCPHLCHTVFV